MGPSTYSWLVPPMKYKGAWDPKNPYEAHRLFLDGMQTNNELVQFEAELFDTPISPNGHSLADATEIDNKVATLPNSSIVVHPMTEDQTLAVHYGPPKCYQLTTYQPICNTECMYFVPQMNI